MTKGQEIAFAVYGDKDHELGKAIDSAIAEAVSRRTVECAVLANKWSADLSSAERISRYILALNAPPAPAYPFGCKCWLLAENGSWYRKEDFGTYTSTIHPRFDAKHCEVCGAARKGS